MAEKPIVVRVDIRASAEAAWNEIAKTGVVQRAYFDTVLFGELKPGAEYRYATPDGKHTFIRGRVLEVDPPRRLVTTFRFTGKGEPEGKVTTEIEPIPGGVRVTVTHEGLDTTKGTGRRAEGGWKSILGNLRRVLETGDVSAGMKFQYFLMRLFMPLMPKGE